MGPSVASSPADFARMKAGGVSVVRLLISWPTVQPTPNSPFDFSQIDPQVANASAAGIRVLPFVYGTPTWAVQGCTADPALCDRTMPTGDAVSEAGWQQFLSAAVRRYGHTGTFWGDPSDAFNPAYQPITTWQIWNEENSTEFSLAPSSAAYVRLLQLSNYAIKSVDPNAKIMLGGLFRPVAPKGDAGVGGGTRDNFLNELYALGARDLFDFVAMHPYSATIPELKTQLKATRSMVKRNHDAGTKIWITEYGYGSNPRPPGRVPLQRLQVGLKGQALLVRRALGGQLVAKRRKYGIGGVIWFTWKDVDPAVNDARCVLCLSAGMFTADGAPKPAWFEFTRISGGRP